MDATPLALRLKTLRTDRGYSLQDLADRSGISRATLSRIENAEVSPTAETLGALAAAFGMTISRILAPVERPFQALIPREEQTTWHDPRGGFTRTVVSPPSGALSIEIIRCELAPRQTIAYDKPPVPGLEHHLTLLSGALTVTVEEETYRLQPRRLPPLSPLRRHPLRNRPRRCFLPARPRMKSTAMDTIEIRTIAPSDFPAVEHHLADILADGVTSGAAISFMQPHTTADGLEFWRTKVFPDVTAGKRVLFAAYLNGTPVGTVQLDIALPPNQPHRCDVAKMIVHSRARRKGIARRLMRALEDHAKSLGKTLITLDTRTGDNAEKLYASLGFEPAGIIPNYAYDPDGAKTHATTYMYKEI